MTSWYVAPALDTLRDELNARWPGRDRSSDGAIGDPSHQARKSDHNPDWTAGGVVRARDFDVDGIDVNGLVAELLADDRTRYVIYNRQIAKRVPGGFRWEPYDGINPHTGHVHVSVRVGPQYENDTRPWFQEDDMTPDQSQKLDEIHRMLGAGGALTAIPVTRSDLTIGARVKDVQLALTKQLPVLVDAAKRPSTDPKEVAAAVVAAIPTDLAQDVIDGLAERLKKG